jgi:hypothetical protein
MYGARQLQQSKEYQAKLAKDASDYNYKVYKDFAKLDFDGLDGNHKAVLKEIGQGFAQKSLEMYRDADKNGTRIDLSKIEEMKAEALGAKKIMMGHQQSIKDLNKLYKEGNGLYREEVLQDAMNLMFEKDENGKLDTRSPNLEYSPEDISALINDPKYYDENVAARNLFDQLGKTINTATETKIDPVSGEAMKSEENFQLLNITSNGDVVKDKFGRPVPKANIDTLGYVYENDPKLHAAIVKRSEDENREPVDILTDILRENYPTSSKGVNTSRVAKTKGSASDKEYTVDVVEGESELGNELLSVKSESIPMDRFVKGLTINDKDGQTATSADFNGFYLDPETDKPAFRFTSKESFDKNQIKYRYLDLSDSGMLAQIRNQLPEGTKKREAFEQAYQKAKGLKNTSRVFDEDLARKKSKELIQLVFDYEEKPANTLIKELGLEGVDFSKNIWYRRSNKFTIDGKEYFSNSDSDKIEELLLEKIKEVNKVDQSESSQEKITWGGDNQ